jgi:tRNA splicing endonuclease
MNALDYVRDNRLRLWFIDPVEAVHSKPEATNTRANFERVMTAFFRKAGRSLKRRGCCVLVVGDTVNRSGKYPLSEVVLALARDHAPALTLERVITDTIPDIRRARRLCHGVRHECVLVFRKRRE